MKLEELSKQQFWMKECEILGVKHTLTLSTYFQAAQPPWSMHLRKPLPRWLILHNIRPYRSVPYFTVEKSSQELLDQTLIRRNTDIDYCLLLCEMSPPPIRKKIRKNAWTTYWVIGKIRWLSMFMSIMLNLINHQWLLEYLNVQLGPLLFVL